MLAGAGLEVSLQTPAPPVATATAITGTLHQVNLLVLVLMLMLMLLGHLLSRVSPVAMAPQVSMVADVPVAAVARMFDARVFLAAPAFAVVVMGTAVARGHVAMVITVFRFVLLFLAAAAVVNVPVAMVITAVVNVPVAMVITAVVFVL